MLNPVQHVELMMPEPSSSRPAGLVPAVARALAVMDLLARERRPMRMAGLAAALDLPKSSMHGLCNTLLSCGYLRRVGDGALQIGPGVMSLAQAFLASTHVAGEFDALWRDAGAAAEDTLVLSVLNGADVVYVGVRNSARPLGLAFTIGMRLPAHLAGTGKAMLAFLDAAEVRALLPPGPLPRLTGGGSIAVDDLLDELALTRERGYSIDDGGIREGVYSIAAPVFDAGGRPVAGIAVCINRAVLSPAEHERQSQVVTQAARRLSLRLGARVDRA
jgi:DNA-binding IclR family transcriptional regulator